MTRQERNPVSNQDNNTPRDLTYALIEKGDPVSTQDNNTSPILTNLLAQTTRALSFCGGRLDDLTDWMERFTGRTLHRGSTAALLLAGLLVGGAALFVVIWLLSHVLAFLDWLFGGQAATEAGDSATGLVHSLTPLARVALDPIANWMNTHATGLPVTAAHLLLAWTAGGAALFLGGVFSFRGARVGWPVYGALTAAMAWFGAQPEHRPIAAGLIALTWSVLSIFVLHRGGTARPIHITNVLPKPTDA